MKLTRYMVILQITEEKMILLNSLNGKVFEITRREYEQILQMKNKKEILESQDEFVRSLKEGGFIIDCNDIEKKEFEELLKKLREKKEERKENITEIVLVLTYECNFACPYCYEKNVKKSRKYFSKEMIDKIFELYSHANKIAFFGGEPLLMENKDIIEYVIEKKSNAIYSVMTNGYYLEEYCDVFKSVRVECIQVTVDGPECIHDKSRILKEGTGTYKKVMKGVYKALTYGYPVRIRMNVSEKNVKECIELRQKLLDEWNIFEELLSFELYPIFQADKKSNLFKTLYEEDFDETTSKKHMIKKNNILQSGLPIENYFTVNKPLRPIINYCEAHTNKRFFDVEGNIYSCILSVGRKDASVGTFYPKYEMKEKSFVTRDISKIEECIKCKYAFLCGGGCPLQLLNEQQDIYLPNCKGIYNLLNDRLPCIIRGKYIE